MNRELAEFVEDLQGIESADATARRFGSLASHIGAGAVTTFFGSRNADVFYSSLPDWWFDECVRDGDPHQRLHMVQAVRRGERYVVWGHDLCRTNPASTRQGIQLGLDQTHHFGLRTNIIFPMADMDGRYRGGGVSFAFADSGDAFRRRLKRSRGALCVASFAAYDRIRSLHRPQMPDNPLSARERDVLMGLTEGLHVSRIADRLMISDSAVNLYVSNAKKKLRARTREQAVAVALTKGWLKLG